MKTGNTSKGCLWAVALCAVISLSSASNAWPETGHFETATIEIGVSAWISQGSTTWSHDASSADPALGNPTSELNYEDVWSNVVELRGVGVLRNGLFVRGRFGYGGITDGILIDDDFAAGPVLASRTRSGINDDDLWYLNGDIGHRFLEFPGNRGHLSAFVGYQYWREEARARGVLQVYSDPSACATIGLTCPPAGTVVNANDLVITNTTRWNSIRVGFESTYYFTRRLTVAGDVALIPYTVLDNEDVHHLRTDLRKDPSFAMEGTGLGANLEVEMSYRILRSVIATIGYRFWWLRVSDGDWTTRPLAGAPATFPLREFESMRHGATVGLSYRF